MIRFVVGALLILATTLGAILVEGGNPLDYLGLTAFMLAFLIPIFAVFCVWDRRTWAGAFRAAFGKQDADPKISARLWGLFESTSYIAGILGFIVGGILVLNYLGHTPWNRSLAACLIAPIYGLFLGLLGKIMKAKVEQNAK